MFGTGGKIGNSFEFVVEQCDFSKPVQTVMEYVLSSYLLLGDESR